MVQSSTGFSKSYNYNTLNDDIEFTKKTRNILTYVIGTINYIFLNNKGFPIYFIHCSIHWT